MSETFAVIRIVCLVYVSYLPQDETGDHRRDYFHWRWRSPLIRTCPPT